jgi:hypothetical protein
MTEFQEKQRLQAEAQSDHERPAEVEPELVRAVVLLCPKTGAKYRLAVRPDAPPEWTRELANAFRL